MDLRGLGPHGGPGRGRRGLAERPRHRLDRPAGRGRGAALVPALPHRQDPGRRVRPADPRERRVPAPAGPRAAGRDRRPARAVRPVVRGRARDRPIPRACTWAPRPGPAWTAGWEAPERRVGHGRPGGPGVVADPPRSGPLPGRPGPGFAARRGRARRRAGDRPDQGLLPGPGVGCTGAEPRASAARLVLGVRAETPLRPGAPVRSNGADVGSVTSVEPRTGLAGIVRIRWDARDRELSADGGIPLERRATPIGGPPILRGP